jgi:hypothetical protein
MLTIYYLMKLSSIITLLGITTIISYCIIQILNFYGLSISSYGVYLMFYVFMVLSYIVLPHQNPSL